MKISQVITKLQNAILDRPANQITFPNPPWRPKHVFEPILPDYKILSTLSQILYENLNKSSIKYLLHIDLERSHKCTAMCIRGLCVCLCVNICVCVCVFYCVFLKVFLCRLYLSMCYFFLFHVSSLPGRSMSVIQISEFFVCFLLFKCNSIGFFLFLRTTSTEILKMICQVLALFSVVEKVSTFFSLFLLVSH